MSEWASENSKPTTGPKLVVLVGMIASGKSTLCKEMARDGAIIVNDDDLICALHGGQYSLYEKPLKTLYKGVEMAIMSQALSMGRTVVVDRGLCISRHARARFVAMARSIDIPVEAVVFPNEGPQVHARRRTESDSRGHNYWYWLDVAQKHQEKWDFPTTEEGFDRVYRVGEWKKEWAKIRTNESDPMTTASN